MYCVRSVTDNLYWVGANDHRTHLFENLPEGWACPECAEGKEFFIEA